MGRATSQLNTHSHSERLDLDFKGGAKGDTKDIGSDYVKRSLKNDVKIQKKQRTLKTQQ